MAGMPERKVVGGYLPAGMVPSGELSAYTPTARERTVDALRRALYSDDRAGQDKAERLMSVPDAYGLTLPLDAYDVARTAAEGRPGAALAMGMLSFLPGKTPKVPALEAFHSSRHPFDKFRWDDSVRGIGEGHQMITDGVYLAQAPEVSDQGGHYWNQFLRGMEQGPESAAAHFLRKNNFDRDAAAAEAVKAAEYMYADGRPLGPLSQKAYESNVGAAGLLKSGQPFAPYTYKVRINIPEQKLLDWDEALKYQTPEMRDRMMQVMKESKGDNYKHAAFEDMTGEDVMGLVHHALGYNKARAADIMLANDIPGVKYFDGLSRQSPYTAKFVDLRQQDLSNPTWISVPAQSRAAAEKYLDEVRGYDLNAPGVENYARVEKNPGLTSNYVIRDVDKMEILKRYAMPGLLGAGMIKAATDQNRETQ